MNAYTDVLRKYTVFSGRAGRSEYWMFYLINLVIGFVIGFVETLFGSPGILGALYGLAVLLPSLAVATRRLHDTGRSGLWLLLALVPVIGIIALIIFFIQDSQPGTNAYGPHPSGGAA